MARSRTRRSTIGLDIEPSYLAAAQVSVNGAVTVEHAATAPLDPGIMRDGEVVDVEALGDALKQFFGEHKLPRRVRLGVANQRIVVRNLELPNLSNAKELDAAVRFQAQEHLPMQLDLAVLDYQSLGVVQTEEGERRRVVLVAARRDMIDRLLEAARRAGLRPEGIDLSAFAMVRALARPSAEGESDRQGALLYMSVGGLTNLAIAEGTQCRFTRVAAGGLESIVAQLAERRALTLDHSRQWLTHVGLEAPVETIDGDPEIVAEARTVLADGVRRIADDVRNSLDYYRAQEAVTAVEGAVVTGPAVGIPAFVDQLAADLDMRVEPGHVGSVRPEVLAEADAGSMAVAAGLAIEEVPA
jgi:type IV pilus assembly protein PilM